MLKTITLTLIFLFSYLLLSCVSCSAAEVSIGYGWDIPIESLRSEELEISVEEVEVSTGSRPWSFSLVIDRLQGEVKSPHVIDGDFFSGDYYGLALSGRLGFEKHFFLGLSGRLFGGFGFLPESMPEIEHSMVVSHFGGQLLYRIGEWSIGYNFTHISDPFCHGDKGWNVQFVSIGYHWK